jgi:hypothetical protein
MVGELDEGGITGGLVLCFAVFGKIILKHFIANYILDFGYIFVDPFWGEMQDII